MQNGDDLCTGAGQSSVCLHLGKSADANDPLWLQQVDDATQMFITRALNGVSLVCGQLVRCAIAARLLHEHERAVVDDEVIGEKCCSMGESIRE